jgi:glucose uptake protein GlcU
VEKLEDSEKIKKSLVPCMNLTIYIVIVYSVTGHRTLKNFSLLIYESVGMLVSILGFASRGREFESEKWNF